VLPITSLSLAHTASNERISSGIKRLDEMLGAKGFYRGSSILVSGQAGTGKTSVAAAFVNAACKRGERSLYFLFEESESQLVRNMRSIGIDLAPHVKKGLLKFYAVRPTAYSIEMHLSLMLKLFSDFRPSVIAVDPISNLYPIGDDIQVRSMMMRLIDYAKSAKITGLFTNLSIGSGIGGAYAVDQTDMHVSSLMDAWLVLKNVEGNGERNRAFSIIKSRGMAHSSQMAEFVLSDKGIDILDPYLGSGGVLFGSARMAQADKEVADSLIREQETERKKREIAAKKQQMEAEIAMIKARFAREEEELQILLGQDQLRERTSGAADAAIAASRRKKERP